MSRNGRRHTLHHGGAAIRHTMVWAENIMLISTCCITDDHDVPNIEKPYTSEVVISLAVECFKNMQTPNMTIFTEANKDLK
jgi:hypothetical protein